MKAFAISQAVFAAIMGAFAASIAWPATGFTHIAGLAIWLLIVVSIVITCALINSVGDAEKGTGEAREKGLKVCRNLIERLDKYSLPRRVLSWAESIAIVLVAAYTGRVMAAAFYAFAIVLIQLAVFGARQAVEKADAAQAKPAEA